MDNKNNHKSPFGNRLKEIRTIKNLSQKELGILAGIDKFSASPRINQYERQKHVPDYLTATLLANALDIPVAYLYTEDDEMAEFILAYNKATKSTRKKVRQMLSTE